MNEKLKQKRMSEFVVISSVSNNHEKAITKEEVDRLFLEWIEEMLRKYT